MVSRYVLVVGDDNRIKYNPVEVGRNVGKCAIVESGVSPDDRIVVAGNGIHQNEMPLDSLYAQQQMAAQHSDIVQPEA